MSAPQLSRRQVKTGDVAGGKAQVFDPNVVVMHFLSSKWSTHTERPKISGREGWFDASFPIQICCHPATHGINKRNILTLGAGKHRRDPVIAIHMFARDPVALAQIREEVDRIITSEGVDPMEGVNSILPATWPSLPGDYEEQGEMGTVFHDIYYVEVLWYRNSLTRN